jgi:hypothetical protein
VKSSVYLESSVISYLAARPTRDVVVAARQAISHEWWNNDRQRFDLRISALVEEEKTLGDEDAAKRRQDLVVGIPSLAISDEAPSVSNWQSCSFPKASSRREVKTTHCTSALLPRKAPTSF